MATQFMACARYYTFIFFSLFWGCSLRFLEPLEFARTLRKNKNLKSQRVQARSFVKINTITIGYAVILSSGQDILKLCFTDRIILETTTYTETTRSLEFILNSVDNNYYIIYVCVQAVG